jgi:hypothetical protein
MRPGLALETCMQRRAATRYKLHLPVIFRWSNGTDHTEGGFTWDVALDGAQILSTKCPPVGVDIRIEVVIPSPDQNCIELRIECAGRVTRVVNQAGYSAFVVRGMFEDDHLTRWKSI